MKAKEFLPRPHLFLDMDGVQADFFTAWARWHARRFGQSHVERYKDIGSPQQREKSITELSAEGPEFVERFFATLPTLPGGQKLIRWLRQNQIPFTVLSAPLRGNHESSIAGKRTWLDAHNPGTSDSAIFTGEKQRYATAGGRPNVLVDDFKKYIGAWQGAGGIGLLYRDNNVDQIIQQLSKIYGIDQDLAEQDKSREALENMATMLPGSPDEYYVRFTDQDKIGFSARQHFGRTPDVDDPRFDPLALPRPQGRPALWFYPLRTYIRNRDLYASDKPYTWLVRIRPDAWLQRLGQDDKTPPPGKTRVGMLRRDQGVDMAVFFKPAFDVVDRWQSFGRKK